jgi:tRNA U54 and U55 pseudouridine synthase Pus10
VIQVEGSRSYKAIAFINSKSNPRNTRLKKKKYSKLRRSLPQTQVFSKNNFTVRKPARKYFNKNLSDEKWIK